jgi:uroporphyrinogen-III decarboxylase
MLYIFAVLFFFSFCFSWTKATIMSFFDNFSFTIKFDKSKKLRKRKKGVFVMHNASNQTF